MNARDSADIDVMASISHMLARAACVALTCAAVVGASAPVHAASTSTSTVGVTVPSATQMDMTGCQTGVAGVTSLGLVPPGSSVRSTSDCTVSFGSSNDTSSLRISQLDSTASAMNAVEGWTQVNTGSADNFGGVSAPTTTRAWVVGGNGSVRTSTNGGTTWAAQTTGTFQFLEDVDGWDGSTAWIVGSTGVLFGTTDGGTTWTAQTSGVATQLTSVEPLSATTVVVVGAAGVVLRTTDGGATWAPMTSGTPTGLNDVTHVGNDFWAVGYAGTVRVSHDGGVTWAGQATGSPKHLYGVATADANTIWAVGELGTILRSTNGGAAWAAQTSPVATDLLDVYAVSATEAWAVGMNGKLIRTIDAGANWSVISTGGTLQLTGIDFSPDGRGLISGFSGTAFPSGLYPINDYSASTSNWAGTGSNAFGACLAGVGGGASQGGGGWIVDTNGTAGDCLLSDAEPWNPITTSQVVVARNLTPGTMTGTAALRYGMRASSTQYPGTYTAAVAFTVLAP